MIIADAVSLRMSCDRARVGAVITVGNRIMSTGYGGAPSGMPSCDEVGHELVDINGRQSCVRTIHAEKNAIITAARYGVKLAAGTLYTTASPCRDCFMAAVQTGISDIVYGSEYIGGKAFDLAKTAHDHGIGLHYIPIAEALKQWAPPPRAVSVRKQCDFNFTTGKPCVSPTCHVDGKHYTEGVIP
jgi:dCMP deaminase